MQCASTSEDASYRVEDLHSRTPIRSIRSPGVHDGYKEARPPTPWVPPSVHECHIAKPEGTHGGKGVGEAQVLCRDPTGSTHDLPEDYGGCPKGVHASQFYLGDEGSRDARGHGIEKDIHPADAQAYFEDVGERAKIPGMPMRPNQSSSNNDDVQDDHACNEMPLDAKDYDQYNAELKNGDVGDKTNAHNPAGSTMKHEQAADYQPQAYPHNGQRCAGINDYDENGNEKCVYQATEMGTSINAINGRCDGLGDDTIPLGCQNDWSAKVRHRGSRVSGAADE